jgi:hypothetical protein
LQVQRRQAGLSARPLSLEARAPVARARKETTSVGWDVTASKDVAADLRCVTQDLTKGNCLDWNWDEDRCTLRAGHGPQSITRSRCFAIGLIRSKSDDAVAHTINKLARSVRPVCDTFA